MVSQGQKPYSISAGLTCFHVKYKSYYIMLVNLCLVMRLVLSDVDYLVVQNYTILPCSDNWEPHSATSQKAPRSARREQYLPQNVQRYILKSLFGNKLHDVILANDEELRLRVKSPVAKVEKILWPNNREPYVGNYFEPLPRRFKPVTIIHFRHKDRVYPHMGATNPDLVKIPGSFYDTNVEDKK